MKIALETGTKRPAAALKALRSGKTLRLTYKDNVVEVALKYDPAAELERMRKHPAFGAWADRKDMDDPNEWRRAQRRARNLRVFGNEEGALFPQKDDAP